METKSIKISEEVHKELKIFVAGNSEFTITEIADDAICARLKEMGHRFTHPKKMIKFNTNNK